MLNALGHFDLASLGHNSPRYIDLVSRVMQWAFADWTTRLGDPELTAECVAAGCLIQVTVEGLVDADDRDVAAVRAWADWGLIHLLGSDGHRIDGRRPRLKQGFNVLAKWLGTAGAERIAGLWNTAVLQGLPVNVPPPRPPKKGWFAGLFGG